MSIFNQSLPNADHTVLMYFKFIYRNHSDSSDKSEYLDFLIESSRDSLHRMYTIHGIIREGMSTETLAMHKQMFSMANFMIKQMVLKLESI